MIMDAVTLMIVGMGTVMLFLGLLYAVMCASAFVFRRYIKELDPGAEGRDAESAPAGDVLDAAIALAVIRHRRTR